MRIVAGRFRGRLLATPSGSPRARKGVWARNFGKGGNGRSTRNARESGAPASGESPARPKPVRKFSARSGNRQTGYANAGAESAGTIEIRPTSDRARESLFSTLSSRGAVEDSRVLDLFAGTGALGLEALSRGARFARFVDNGSTALDLIRENVALLGVEAECGILAADAARLPLNDGDAYDLAFLDPPYGRNLAPLALASALAGGWITPGALVAVEESAPVAAPAGFSLLDSRRLGAAHFTLFERVAD